MKRKNIWPLILVIFWVLNVQAQTDDIFKAEIDAQLNPWTHLDFANDPANFQFAIVSDRTGGHREGIFADAVAKLNLLMPEFVMSVGDLIEGYLEDTVILNAQWKEFHALVEPLKMPFFFLPGNHDISNEVMRDLWLKQFGKSYYHFVYQNVLFIAMDTNEDGGVSFSEDQIEYVINAIEENADVRWTFIFMHHPVWRYEQEKKFERVEEVLKGRKYSVLAGHQHRYLHEERHDHNYYVLATTGGGSSLDGPRFGRFDHITWVTMTDNAPVMVNLKLDGILPHDISNAQSMEYAQQILKNTEFRSLVLSNPGNDFQNGQVRIYFDNELDQTLQMNGRFFHHHQVSPGKIKFDLEIEPSSHKMLNIDFNTENKLPKKSIDPVDMMWTMKYQLPGRPEVALDGNYQILFSNKEANLIQSEADIFTDTMRISFTEYEKNLPVYYTLDGSTPTTESIKYSESFVVKETTTIKARAIAENGLMSEVDELNLEKVPYQKPVKKGSAKAGRLGFKYFEGEWQNLPDFNQINPVEDGYAREFDPENLAAREDQYAMVFEGFIEVPSTGMYRFYTRADDQSRLSIGKRVVVDGEPSENPRWRSGLIPLEKGLHPFKVEYLERYQDQSLQIGYRNPDNNQFTEVKFDHLFAP